MFFTLSAYAREYKQGEVLKFKVPNHQQTQGAHALIYHYQIVDIDTGRKLQADIYFDEELVGENKSAGTITFPPVILKITPLEFRVKGYQPVILGVRHKLHRRHHQGIKLNLKKAL